MALTFDDGPDSRSTPALVDLLAAHRVRATFFLLSASTRRQRSGSGPPARRGGSRAGRTADPSPGRAGAAPPARRAAAPSAGPARGPRVAAQWCRSPYGVWTPHAEAATQRRPPHLLWSAWGRTGRRVPRRTVVVRRVEVCLHPAHSAPPRHRPAGLRHVADDLGSDRRLSTGGPHAARGRPAGRPLGRSRRRPSWPSPGAAMDAGEPARRLRLEEVR
ncbi:MAG: polysaccharide deacetylase family protein [Nocardioides sp.]